MTDFKERRLRAVADLIRTQPLANQEEVATRLGALGFEVTQATLSRDLEQLGAVKVRRNGTLAYALPQQVRDSQKRILIGAKGSRIREIGRVARTKIETLIGAPVYLDLWVKVLPNWRRDLRSLKRFGYVIPKETGQ